MVGIPFNRMPSTGSIDQTYAAADYRRTLLISALLAPVKSFNSVTENGVVGSRKKVTETRRDVAPFVE
jgi:hypothetical protein